MIGKLPDLATKTLRISQSSYIRDFFEERNLTNCNSPTILMKAGSFIEIDEPDSYEKADLGVYQRLIGKLMYLTCGIRPDIAFAVGRLSKHNADPRKGHLRAAKRVVRYLKGKIQLELVYGQRPDGCSPIDPAPYGLVRYGDSNFAGDSEDRKSIMGYCFFLNGAVVSWSSKKQKTVSTSTTEVEYIAIGKRRSLDQEIHKRISTRDKGSKCTDACRWYDLGIDSRTIQKTSSIARSGKVEGEIETGQSREQRTCLIEIWQRAIKKAMYLPNRDLAMSNVLAS